MQASQLLPHKLNNALHAALLLGGLAALLMAIGWVLGGASGLLWAGVLGGAGLLFTPRISPALILRMYNARPLPPIEAPGLYALVERLAAQAGLVRAPTLYYLPTQVMNAFSVGRRGEAVIAVTDGLLRSMPPRQLTGVLAHEIGHIRHNDMWIMSLADAVSRIVRAMSFMGQVLILINLPMYLLHSGSMPWLPLLLLVAAPSLSALLQLALSRNREFDADLEAARVTGDPLGLADALVRLEAQQTRMWRYLLWPGSPNRQPSLLRTHPNSEARIARLRALLPAAQPMAVAEPPLFAAERWAVPQSPPRGHWHGLWF
jgi:heat shock protein HtpX